MEIFIQLSQFFPSIINGPTLGQFIIPVRPHRGAHCTRHCDIMRNPEWRDNRRNGRHPAPATTRFPPEFSRSSVYRD